MSTSVDLVLTVEVNERSESTLKCPVETLVAICVREYTGVGTLQLETRPSHSTFVQVPLDALESHGSSSDELVECQLPAVRQGNLLSGGVSAAARRLAKVGQSLANVSPPHHPQGLLGFRGSCLHAPNETSVWTKFCEIEMVETTKRLVQDVTAHSIDPAQYQIPDNLARFERHLTQPLRVHNIYKLAREMTKLALNAEPTVQNGEALTEPRRVKPKSRKCKSKSEVVIENCALLKSAGLVHEFAEGPHLTLADVLLYPCFYLIFHTLDLERLRVHLPETVKWFQNLQSLSQFGKIDMLMRGVFVATFPEGTVMLKDAQYSMCDVENCSLYKCDPGRDKCRKKVFTKNFDVETALGFITDGLELELCKMDGNVKNVDWSTIPPAANPFGGHLPLKRVERKTQQLENLALAVLNLAKDGDRIVDFCSGGGHLGILLAYLLPACNIVLLENKEQSLGRGQVRVEALHLKNVSFVQCNLDFFTGSFDIGVALHACGVSTDLVLDKCIKQKATFVVCPCCYGSLHETDRLQYPRSSPFRDVPVDRYMCIGHSADQTHVNHPMEERGVRCMKIIDSDRARHAIGNGYSVLLSQLQPKSCTPKNMLLVGVCTLE